MSEITLRSDMTVDLVDHMGSDDSILRAMMVSTKKDATVAEMNESAKRGRIEFLMKNRHGTPFEMNAMMFYVEAPIVVFREWHRHRIGVSYNEMSGRYTELEPVFYVPDETRALVQVGKPGAYTYEPGTPEMYADMIATKREAYWYAWHAYQTQLKRGVAKEVARMCLPVATYSRMYTTINARSLMNFLSLRTKDERSTYPSFPMHEINLCASALEEHFAQLFPLTYSAFNKFGRVSP